MPHPIVRPIQQTDLELLTKAANADAHIVIYPTHLITRENKIVGYFSIKPPYCTVWCSTKDITARDSVHLMGILDALVAQSGFADYIMLCANDSNYAPVLNKLGFTAMGGAVLGYKKLYQTTPTPNPTT